MLADPLLQRPWTLQLTQWFILTIEFLSPALLFVRPKVQQYLVAFLLGFHVMTYLMIRIIFMPHVVCLAAFLPLEKVVNRKAQTPVSPARLRGAGRGCRAATAASPWSGPPRA